MVHRGHRPGGGHPSAGRAVHDPHPEGALCGPLEYERNKGIYVLTRRKLERARPDMLVMHPLPRVDEITVDVDDDPAPSTSSRPGMGCSPAWPFWSTWPSSPGRAPRSSGDRHAPHLPQSPLHHPNGALPAPSGQKGLAAWTAAASVTRPWAETPPAGLDAPPGKFSLREKKLKKD